MSWMTPNSWLKIATEMKRIGYHRVNYEVLDVYAEKVSQVCKELIHYTPAEKAERDKCVRKCETVAGCSIPLPTSGITDMFLIVAY